MLKMQEAHVQKLIYKKAYQEWK